MTIAEGMKPVEWLAENERPEVSEEGVKELLCWLAEIDVRIAEIEGGQFKHSPEAQTNLLRLKTTKDTIQAVGAAIFPSSDPDMEMPNYFKMRYRAYLEERADEQTQ